MAVIDGRRRGCQPVVAPPGTMLSDDDDDGSEFRRALDAEMERKAEELRALEGLRQEVGFAPRKSLARTPPQGFGTPPATICETVTPPYGTPSAGTSMGTGKRPLSSPAGVPTQGRRKVGRNDDMPPIAGIITAAPTPSAPPVPPVTARSESAGTETLADASVEGLTGLATGATKGIMDAVRSKTSKLNKEEIATIGAHTERLGAVIAHMALRLAAAEAKLQAQSIAQPAGPVRAPEVTYAQRLKLPRRQEPIEISQKDEGPVLVFGPAAESEATMKTAEDTKAELKKAIDPAKIWVQVSKVRKIGNARVVVQTTSTGAASRLKEAMPATLRVSEPKRRQPLVCLNRIDGDPSFEDVLVALRDQNYRDDPVWTLEKIRKEASGAFKKHRARGTATAVIFACSAAFRESLLNKGRVFIGWQVVEVTDYVETTCCKKCQQYGHPERYCRATEVTCGRCGANGHKSEDCKAETTCCATCKRFAKPGAESHKTASRECPARRHAEERCVEMTHYG